MAVLLHAALGPVITVSAELKHAVAEVFEDLSHRPDTLASGLAADPTLTAPPSRRSDEALPPLSTPAAADPPDALPPAALGGGAVIADHATAPMSSASQAPANASALAPHTSGWSEALGERVLWLIGNRISAAQLNLNPPELGPLEVRIVLDGDKAHVHFASAHAQVRDALESALPRLRELLGEAGIQLLDAGVRDAWSGTPRSTRADAEWAFGAEGDELAVAAADHSRRAAARIAEGLLDLYV